MGGEWGVGEAGGGGWEGRWEWGAGGGGWQERGGEGVGEQGGKRRGCRGGVREADSHLGTLQAGCAWTHSKTVSDNGGQELRVLSA